MGSDDELTNHPLSRRIDARELTADLSRLLRRGLPVTEKTAGPVLPHLRSVVARAIHPDDLVSRIDSLNVLLTRLLAELDHERYGQPARILFGVAPTTAGTTLMNRRQRAAEYLGYDPDHFRKRVEPDVVRAVADALYHDLLRYKKRVTGGDTFADYSVWGLTERDITAEEELASIVWKFAYAVRSELIGARRHAGQPGFEARVAEHERMAAKYAEALRRAAENYKHLFGSVIRHGNAEYRVEALAALVYSPVHRRHPRDD